MIRHFYHVWAEGAWSAPVNEHVNALVAAEFSGQITVSLVGPPIDRAAARVRLTSRLAELHSSPVDWIETDTGFEQVTLSALRASIRSVPPDSPVLYAHTKGAYHQSPWSEAWRRSMTRYVVTGWRQCVQLLADGYDTVGCHWLNPGDAPAPYEVKSSYYGGNFWWATASYLRRLPPPSETSRYDAEAWIGLGEPRAFDLRPGWPGKEMFLPATGRRNALLKH